MTRPDDPQAPPPAARGEAVALARTAPDDAPRVVAKGYGVAAESIMREARAHGLYVHAAPDLVRLLMQVELDRHIPPQLYRAVAEVMAWVHGVESGAGMHPQPISVK